MSAATRWPYALLALDPTIVTPSPGNPANDPPRTYNANGEHEPRTPRACAPSKAANAAAGHSASPGPISRAPTAAAAARSASARRTASAADTSCIRAAVADNTDRGACPVSTPRHACTAPTRSTNTATAAADGGSHTRNNPARARATYTPSPATSTTDCSLTSTRHSARPTPSPDPPSTADPDPPNQRSSTPTATPGQTHDRSTGRSAPPGPTTPTPPDPGATTAARPPPAPPPHTATASPATAAPTARAPPTPAPGPPQTTHPALRTTPTSPDQEPADPPGCPPDPSTDPTTDQIPAPNPRRARALHILRRRARTRIRRQDQLKPRRKPHRPRSPRQQHHPRLHRLSQRVQHRRTELRRIIQEQHAAVGEADAAGPDVRRTTTDHRGQRRRVVRVDERGPGDQRSVLRQRPGHRVHRGHLQRLLGFQRRQHAGQPGRQHRLAGARRPDHRQVMPACGRDLQGQPGLRLPQHVGQVRHRPVVGGGCRLRRYEVVALPSQPRDQVGKAAHPVHPHPGRQRRLRDVPGRDHGAHPTGRTRRQQARQDAAHRPYRTVQTQLADQHSLPRATRRDTARRRENRYCQCDVVAGTAFGQCRRRQRQGDPAIRPFLPRIEHRSPHPITRLGDRRISHPDHRGPRQPGRQVRLDRHQMPGDPGQRHRPRPRERHQNASARCSISGAAPGRHNTPITSNRIAGNTFTGFAVNHNTASRRSLRRLAWVTASNGDPNPSPLRVFTSQNTTVESRSVATMSNSPSAHRQFRASTTNPARSSTSTATSSPRRPNSSFAAIHTPWTKPVAPWGDRPTMWTTTGMGTTRRDQCDASVPRPRR